MVERAFGRVHFFFISSLCQNEVILQESLSMVELKNALVRAVINPRGAELTSLYNFATALEYMWSGDPAFWGKHSPVLFPVVGTLKDQTYFFQEKKYTLPRHGFARDRMFDIERQDANSVVFLLSDDNDSLMQYPFHFQLRLIYTLINNSLRLQYAVTNPGPDPLYFSVGGHPAFRVPLEKGLQYRDYELVFDRSENSGRWPISSEGLIETNPVPLLEHANRLPLSHELFYRDALVFKDLSSQRLELRSAKSTHGLSVEFDGFPFLGIWAARDADFVCIEPWCGIADPVDSSQQLPEKEGIQQVAAGQSWERSWQVTVY